jgi:glycosyltransferase involved in cell wall biosynthesis
MNGESVPLVSVVTPVYNGAEFLSECIQSVPAQTYTNWEYLIVDNGSTDSTLKIAQQYQASDQRIRVYHFDEFLDVIGSHNRALRLISHQSKYCKILSADDRLYPECLNRMVRLAEANPSVGIVGAYSLSGSGKAEWRLKFDGLPYEVNVVSGREACRSHLLGDHHYYLGIPTSVLYRSDLVRRKPNFYPNSREHADISAFYDCLRDADYGFVHEVLSFERIHEAALSAEAKRLHTLLGSRLLDVQLYGPAYLTETELDGRLDGLLDQYYDMLAAAMFGAKGKRFWSYHKAVLQELEAPLYGTRMAKAVCLKIVDWMFNPKQTVEKLLRRRGSTK